MTKDEALKLALEALEELNDTEQTYAAIDRGDTAISAIKEALAQQDHIPDIGKLVTKEASLPAREWVGLTDDERNNALGPVSLHTCCPPNGRTFDDYGNKII